MDRALEKTLDTSLIDAARRGSRESRARLLRDLQDPWYRLCHGLLRDPDMARDAVQESAYRLLRDLPKFRGDSSVKTWAFGIAINVCRELRRRRYPTGPEMDRPGGVDPADTATDTESASAVRAVLDELPERQREAVMLRFFEQLSVQDTAAAMRCAEGTVKATVHQALRWLRERLKAYQ